jgi:hypothetical protein
MAVIVVMVVVVAIVVKVVDLYLIRKMDDRLTKISGCIALAKKYMGPLGS